MAEIILFNFKKSFDEIFQGKLNPSGARRERERHSSDSVLNADFFQQVNTFQGPKVN